MCVYLYANRHVWIYSISEYVKQEKKISSAKAEPDASSVLFKHTHNLSSISSILIKSTPAFFLASLALLPLCFMEGAEMSWCRR